MAETGARAKGLGYWVGISTAYLFVLMFANLYGFWKPFSVNVFTMVGVLDVLSNGLFYVADVVISVATVSVCAGLLFVAVRRFAPNARGFRLLLMPERGRMFFSGMIVVMGCVTVVPYLVIIFSGIPVWRSYLTTLLIYGVFVMVGCYAIVAWIDQEPLRGEPWAWFMAVLAFALGPAGSFQKGARAAEAIEEGCGATRVTVPSAGELGLDLSGGRPVYLGHVGEYFVVRGDLDGVVTVIRLADGQRVGLSQAKPLACE